MKIQAILLSEFNERAGLRMIHCEPQNQIINSQLFSLCSDLVLPREQFCNRMLAIEYHKNYFIVGIPQISVNTEKDKTYKRAKYIYSLNIIVQKTLYIAGQELYKEIARKLAFFFRALQETYHILYNNSKSIQYLKKNLKHIIQNINEHRQCNLTHMSHHYTFINFNISPFQQSQKHITNSESSGKNTGDLKPYSTITPYAVPITNLTKAEVQNIHSEFGKILMEYALKGDFTMRKIYKLHSDKYKQEQINKFYQRGIKLGVIFMVDLFDIHNRYALTPEIINYTKGQNSFKQKFSLASKAMMFTEKQMNLNDRLNEQGFLKKKEPLSEQDILYLYFQLERKIPLKKILQKNMKKFQMINIVKWIRVGQLLNIITRVQQKLFYSPVGGYLYETSKEKQTAQFHSQQPDYNKGGIIQYVTKRSIREHCPSLLWEADGQMYEISVEKKLNDIFTQKLRNMATIDQMCIDMKVDRETLLKITKKEKRCIIMITNQKY